MVLFQPKTCPRVPLFIIVNLIIRNRSLIEKYQYLFLECADHKVYHLCHFVIRRSIPCVIFTPSQTVRSLPWFSLASNRSPSQCSVDIHHHHDHFKLVEYLLNLDNVCLSYWKPPFTSFKSYHLHIMHRKLFVL